jgi:hypothetical protein
MKCFKNIGERVSGTCASWLFTGLQAPIAASQLGGEALMWREPPRGVVLLLLLPPIDARIAPTATLLWPPVLSPLVQRAICNICNSSSTISRWIMVTMATLKQPANRSYQISNPRCPSSVLPRFCNDRKSNTASRAAAKPPRWLLSFRTTCSCPLVSCFSSFTIAGNIKSGSERLEKEKALDSHSQ